MSLTNTNTAEFKETPLKNTKLTGKDIVLKNLDRVGTPSIIWFLLKRHKLGIITTWAIVLTIVQVFPFAPDLVFGLLGR